MAMVIISEKASQFGGEGKENTYTYTARVQGKSLDVLFIYTYTQKKTTRK